MHINGTLHLSLMPVILALSHLSRFLLFLSVASASCSVLLSSSVLLSLLFSSFSSSSTWSLIQSATTTECRAVTQEVLIIYLIVTTHCLPQSCCTSRSTAIDSMIGASQPCVPCMMCTKSGHLHRASSRYCSWRLDEAVVPFGWTQFHWLSILLYPDGESVRPLLQNVWVLAAPRRHISTVREHHIHRLAKRSWRVNLFPHLSKCISFISKWRYC